MAEQTAGHAARLRVANVHLDGTFGGPQHRTLQVAARLRRSGVDTVVILPETGSDTFYERLVAGGIEVRRLPLRRLSRRREQWPAWAVGYVPEVVRLAKTLRDARVSVVHCNGVWQTKGLLAAKLAGVKAILHLNDAWTPLGIRAIFAITRHLADGFIVTGRRVMDAYFGGAPPGVAIVPIQAPVDTGRFDPDRVAPDPHLMNGSGPKIAVIGCITPTKGLEQFIEMARRLAGPYPDAHFYIVGPVPPNQRAYGAAIERLVGSSGVPNLSLVGPSSAVETVLKAIDVLVCPSLTESGPMVVWEAMAMGKGIVSTDVGDVTYYMPDGDAGFVVPVGDSAALADRVARLLDDRSLRARLGARARERARQALDIDIAAARHRDFYRQVAAG